jgi:hypothetical protein
VETDVNVHTVSNKRKNLEKKTYFVGILKSTNEKSWIPIRDPLYGSKDPDPYQNVTDPEHWL